MTFPNVDVGWMLEVGSVTEEPGEESTAKDAWVARIISFTIPLQSQQMAMAGPFAVRGIPGADLWPGTTRDWDLWRGFDRVKNPFMTLASSSRDGTDSARCGLWSGSCSDKSILVLLLLLPWERCTEGIDEALWKERTFRWDSCLYISLCIKTSRVCSKTLGQHRNLGNQQAFRNRIEPLEILITRKKGYILCKHNQLQMFYKGCQWKVSCWNKYKTDKQNI